MNWLCRSFRAMLSLALLNVIGVTALPLSPSLAAEWLAPAAEAQISADWVQDVARALRTNQFKNVFVNQPFGCDQCRILEFLNDAAEALESDEPELAKSFVHRALHVFDAGIDMGWYEEADIRPIKRLIIKRAKKGFQEAGAPKLALSAPEKKGRDLRYQRGEDPLFSGSDDSDAYGNRRDRWSGYTSHRRLGLTNEPIDRGRDGRYREKDPFSDEYADQVASDTPMRRPSSNDRGARQSHSNSDSDMSRKQFRRSNERNYEQATKGDRFANAEDLKESANDEYDHSPMRGAQGERLRQPGD